MNLDDIVADNNLDGTIVMSVNWRTPRVIIKMYVNKGKLTASPVNPSDGAFHDEEYVNSLGLHTYLGIGRYYLGSGGHIYQGDQRDHHPGHW